MIFCTDSKSAVLLCGLYYHTLDGLSIGEQFFEYSIEIIILALPLIGRAVQFW